MDDTFRRVVVTYHRNGYNLIPVRCDGSKVPWIKWKRYQTERIPESTLTWYLDLFRQAGTGVVIVCGISSGSLEVIDHDGGEEIYHEWVNRVNKQIPGFLDTMPTVRSPGKGYHVWYRTDRLYDDPKALARVKLPDGTVKANIELLGQGETATPPTPPPYVHKSGKPHQLIHGNILRPPVITAEQRAVLLDAARSFNQYAGPERHQAEEQAVVQSTKRELYGDWDIVERRPGDVYNEVADWADVLEPHGWTCVRWAGRVRYWRKPNSFGPEHHATTDYHDGWMKVFSTSAAPFETDRAYTKFTTFALLSHGGDYNAAAKELARRSDIQRAMSE